MIPVYDWYYNTRASLADKLSLLFTDPNSTELAGSLIKVNPVHLAESESLTH